MMNQLTNAKVVGLLALDPITIKGFNRDSTIRHLGWSDNMTPA